MGMMRHLRRGLAGAVVAGRRALWRLPGRGEKAAAVDNSYSSFLLSRGLFDKPMKKYSYFQIGTNPAKRSRRVATSPEL